MKAAPARLKRMAIAIKTPEPSSRWDADVSWNEFWVNPFYGLTEKPLALSIHPKNKGGWGMWRHFAPPHTPLSLIFG